MIAVDNQPISIVEDLGFTRLMNKLKPNYEIPSRKYVTNNVLPSMHTQLMKKVKQILEEAKYISFTTDIWTSISNDAFMSLTAHCLENMFVQKTAVLQVAPFPESHTSANIKYPIEDVLHEFNILGSKIHLIARDNGANIVKGIHNTRYDGLSCFLKPRTRATYEACTSIAKLWCCR